jgi:hypothetical protein
LRRKGTEPTLLNRHFDPFNLFIDEKIRTILVLSPKVLTSFTRKFLCEGLREFRGLKDPSEGRYRLSLRARSFPLAPVSAYLRLAMSPRAYDCYSLVRNPYHRVHSAWRDKFYDQHMKREGGRDELYPRSMLKGELASFRQFARKHGLAGGEANTLVPFATFLECIAEQKVGRRNHHWDTQSSVIQLQHFSFERVFRMEDELVDCFTTVFERAGFEREWILERLKNPVNPSSRGETVFDEATVQMVRDIYAVDFENFGFCTDLPQGL